MSTIKHERPLHITVCRWLSIWFDAFAPSFGVIAFQISSQSGLIPLILFAPLWLELPALAIGLMYAALVWNQSGNLLNIRSRPLQLGHVEMH